MKTAEIHIPLSARLLTGRLATRINFHRKRRATLPTKWSELNLRHYPALESFFAKIAALPANDLNGITTASAILFCQWMKIDPLHATNKSIIHNSQVLNIGVGFLTQPHTLTPLHKFILWLRGPGSQLTNLRYQQFILAETIYERYRSNPNQKDITLLATITHRAAFMPYIHQLASLRYQLFRILPMRVKTRALFTYIAQRSHLPERYPELYKGADKSAPQLYIDQQILNQCGQELGSFSEVAKAPLHRVLELMQLKEIQALKNNPNYAKRNATVEELHEKAGYKQRPNWAK